jgi:hypothetical protein
MSAMANDAAQPVTFRTQAAWKQWLAKHHRRDTWTYFQTRPPWYRRTTAHWVMSAKKDDTRERRLAALIDCSARQTTVRPLTPSR